MHKKRGLKNIDEMEQEERHPSFSNFLKLKGPKTSPHPPGLLLERRAKETNVKAPLGIKNQLQPKESIRL